MENNYTLWWILLGLTLHLLLWFFVMWLWRKYEVDTILTGLIIFTGLFYIPLLKMVYPNVFDSSEEDEQDEQEWYQDTWG